MKYFLLSLLFSSLLTESFSQQNRPTDVLAEKFVRYYNAEQTDSMYTLFSDEVKKALPQISVLPTIHQIKTPGPCSDCARRK